VAQRHGAADLRQERFIGVDQAGVEGLALFEHVEEERAHVGLRREQQHVGSGAWVAHELLHLVVRQAGLAQNLGEKKP
jgi:hypothetical protein